MDKQRRVLTQAIDTYERVMGLKIPGAHKFAVRMGSITSGVDWRGCSKSAIARAWAVKEYAGLNESGLRELETEYGTRFETWRLAKDHPLRK